VPEHHPKNVTGVLRWCSKCRKNTVHRVDEKREGSCADPGHPVSGATKKQSQEAAKRQQEAEQPWLF